ncbi:hypothetical protein HYW35_02980, partial [Candidatus Saccharibacteria bacterium]|nr:hypothetical protein [Candidatus Saccharibacteria bacterium]
MRLHRVKTLLAKEAKTLAQSAEHALKSTEGTIKTLESSLASELSPASATQAGFVGDEPATALTSTLPTGQAQAPSIGQAEQA